MTPEKDLHYTMIKYFEMEDEKEISNILKHSKVVYEKMYAFSGVVSYQRDLTIHIKTPIEFKKILEEKRKSIEEIIFQVYEDDDEYRANKLAISILASKVTIIELDNIEKEIIEDSIYKSFIREIVTLNLDKIESKYLYEAAECGLRGNLLAATTMLGCAAEYLLINICESYHSYLERNATEKAAETFKKKVLNAKSAYLRLNGFLNHVEAETPLFKSLGFENPKLNFNYLDVIRKVRNESGHPSGSVISEEDLRMTFSTYSHFMKISHNAISQLSTL